MFDCRQKVMRVGVCFVLLCALAALADGPAGSGAPAAPAMRHRLAFDRGATTTYRFTSRLDQEIRTPGLPDAASAMLLTGTLHQVTVDVGNWGRTGLVGQYGAAVLQVFEGRNPAPDITKPQAWLAVFRVGRDNAALVRTSKDLPLFERFRRMGLSRFGDAAQLCPPFPAQAMGVGYRWCGEALLPMPWGRQPANAESCITALRRENDDWISTVESTFNAKRVAAPGYRWNVVTPHLDISGRATGRFNVSRGFWKSQTWELTTKLTGRGERGFEGEIRIASSLEAVPAARGSAFVASAWGATFRALDHALGALHEAHVDDALDGLTAVFERELDQTRRDALAMTLEALLTLQEPEATANTFTVEEAGPAGPAEVLLTQAEDAAAAGRWDEAAALYETVWARHPDSPLVPEALASAAQLQEAHLDRAQADALRQRLIRRQAAHAKATRDALSFYKVAVACTEGGRPELAVPMYRLALGTVRDPLSPPIRMLAQFQLGRALEDTGQPYEAMAAYGATTNLIAQDAYMRNIQAGAHARSAALRQSLNEVSP